ncbi:carbohydrate ABC transporter permease [Phytoactinopolyspora halotolerans]|uniref:Sugar ABC transporter permease n=1 Tax=Phytoactinopolyspora halotolerans TaxID=1981512 RepID=A0A6L9S9E2_9ACTN|nr:sugar ABC transporter permease [Phytoactinopolyspora halotolerans]NEE01707.1 sugar ABC transporter permease [Phytoactinopolyspora halotolerans]
MAIVSARAARQHQHRASSGWRRLRRSQGWVAALFLLPAGFGFALFYLWPALRALWMSFTDYNLLRRSGDFTGLENYRQLVDDQLFWHSMWVTVQYVVINIGMQTVLALAMAVMMDRLTRSVIVRGVLVLPWLIPQVVVGLLWLWMLDPRLGLVNHLLEMVGIGGQAFLGSPDQAVPTLAAINTWRFVGYTALLLFAGLQMIPKQLYEAAAMDGAGEWRMFWRVTLPLLRPVLALVLVLSVVGSFQVFDLVQVATGGIGGQPGGPANSTLVIYVYIFRQAFNFNQAGYAAAMSAVLFVLLACVTFLIMRSLRGSRSDLA